MESIFTSPFSTLDMLEKTSVIAFYLTIAVIALFAIAAVCINKYNKASMPKFITTAKVYMLVHIVSFVIAFSTITIMDMVSSEEIYGKLFYPLLALLIIVAILFVAGYIISKIKPALSSKYNLIALGVACVPTIVVIIFMALYYPEIADWYTNVSQLGLYVGVVLLILLLATILIICSKKPSDENTNSNVPANRTKSLSYGAVAIALSFALSYIKLFALPQGGSVTFASMLPLMIYSYMFGARKGVMMCAIYGVLQAIQDPWIIHPAQFLLDYPIAFAMIGLTGIFREVGLFKSNTIVSFTLGAILVATLRYASHVLSGIFAFSMYAPEGFDAVSWGFLYNLFVYADVAIAIIAGVFALGSKSFRKTLSL